MHRAMQRRQEADAPLPLGATTFAVEEAKHEDSSTRRVLIRANPTANLPPPRSAALEGGASEWLRIVLPTLRRDVAAGADQVTHRLHSLDMRNLTHFALCGALAWAGLAHSPASLVAQSWTQLTPSGSTPPGRFYHTLAYDSARDLAVLFGGLNGTSVVNDTWEWNPTTNVWTQRTPSTSPSARQVMAFTYDAARGRTVVWGGYDGSFLLDTWEWDGTNWQQVASGGPIPGRCGAAMVYDSQRQKCILFGGQGTANFSNDVWEWNGSSWTQTFAGTLTSAAPSPRFFHNMVYDSRQGRVVVFGGTSGAATFGDTWSWTPFTATWANLGTTGPSARASCGMIYDDRIDRTVLYGGENASSTALGETWWLEGSTWTLAPTTNPPAARRRHVMALRPNASKSILFGGQQTGNVLSESWELDTSSIAIVAPITLTSLATTGGPQGLRNHTLTPLPAGGMLLFGGVTANGAQPLTYSLSGTTFQPEYPKFSPVFRTEHTLMFDPNRMNNVLFGGKDPIGTPLAVTWIWANNAWSIAPTSTAPSARSGHTMVFDRQANIGLLFGGENGSGAALNDFWSWDGTSWNQLTPAALPTARARHSMAFDALRNRTVIYGGRNGATGLADVWEWNGTNWTQVNTTLQPSPRHGMGMVYDAGRNRAVLFGGRNNTFFRDTWELSTNPDPLITGLGWSRRPTANSPSARNSTAMTFDLVRNRTMLFAGFDGGAIGETWTFDGVDWTQRTPVNSPPNRSGPAMTFDTARGVAVMFGGFSNTQSHLSDTWEWNGTNWTQRTTATSPPGRMFSQLAFDTTRQRTVAFGGLASAGTLGDTWEYNGTNWTNATPASASPSARQGHTMCFDPARNVTLLFGGRDAIGATDETWVWNGTAWQQLSPTNSPPPREGAGMVFDPARQRVVLFGGSTTLFTSNYSDTWEWDGTNWTQSSIIPANSRWNPGSREGQSMAYDPRSERVILFGGTTAAGPQQDAWSWDGTEWTRLSAQSVPIPSVRAGSQLVFDTVGNRMLLYGGGTDTSFNNDMWELRPPVFARAEPYGTPCIGSRGPLGLQVANYTLPVIGQTFQMEITNIPVFAPTIGYYGFSNTLFNGVPLPLALDFVQLFGCFAYMSADRNVLLPAANNATGIAVWNLAIPLDPVFLSVHVYLQALTLEFGGTRRGTLTNGIDARIGDR